MIDFSKITKTLDGYDCHYFGTRESYGTKLHCFGVWTPTGLYEKCYDDQGRHLVLSPNGTGWEVRKSNAFAIVRPPKIVEVTRWIGIYTTGNGNYSTIFANTEDGFGSGFVAVQKHTFRFEVPNE